MSARRPPQWLERLVERSLPTGLSAQGALGDLAEEYRRRSLRSRWRAWLWYAAQAGSIAAYRAVGGGAGDRDRGSDSQLLMDVRWAVRLIFRHPGFALSVVVVLGLGLGANAAVFSVVDGTFRNTSWWQAPERTLSLWQERELSFGMLELYREDQSAYRSMGGYAEQAYAVRRADGTSQSVDGVAITPELFRELARQPIRGRALADEDARVGVEPVVVVGEGLWRRSFGADPDLVGRTIDVSGTAVRVVGIQPADARAPGGSTELWLPLFVDPRSEDYFRAQNLTAVGVLRDGAGVSDAQQELLAFADHLSDLFPMFYPPGFADGQASVARADQTQRRLIATPLLLLLGGTTLLLLVTALNVGNLLLGRAVERRRELAVRAAIGAGRRRILRQLLVEGGVLTLLAVTVALVGAWIGGPLLAGLFVGERVVTASSVLSPSVAVFALVAAAASWAVLSGVPALHYVRTQRRGLELAPSSGAGMQRGLVVVQASLATLLLVSATLLVRTVDHLRQVPLGFDSQGLLAVALSPPEDRAEDPARARELYDGLSARVGRLPGVRAVGLTGWLPLRAVAPTTPINLESAPVDPAEATTAPLQKVDPGFFEAFGVKPLEGRLLDSRDREARPGAVVVNQTLADRLWPGGTAVGQRIAIDPHAWNRWVTVVGVIPDIRSGEITGPPGPALYVSLAESPARDITVVVRSSQSLTALGPDIRRIVGDIDPRVPVASMTRMGDVVKSAYSVAWVIMGLLVVLAALATALGAIGIYAVLAHHVVAHRREMGVRLALGARPADIVGGVVRSGLTLAFVGVLIGSALALVSVRYLQSLLFQVSALSPWAYAAPALGLTVAAALATWLPAVRAGRLPPAEVLRSE